MNGPVIENRLIERLAASLPRSPGQLNRLGESDAELIRLPGSRSVLALTTDALVEEIEAGLYEDPYLIGWVAAAAGASDLAAVGAEPLGLLLNETFPRTWSDRSIDALQRGVRDLCEAANLAVLGGDLNRGSRLHLECTAAGLIRDGRPLTRSGARSGDLVYASGPVGAGSALAASLISEAMPAVDFRPRPRLAEGHLARRFATSAIDTSDGLLPALDELTRRSGIGIVLHVPPARLLCAEAAETCAALGLPPRVMLAGPHGEFELLLTVPAGRCHRFRRAASLQGWSPIAIGRVVDTVGVFLDTGDGHVAIDTATIRNLYENVNGEPVAYVRELLAVFADHPDRRRRARPGGGARRGTCSPNAATR